MDLERLRRLAGVETPMIVESVEETVEELTEAEMAKVDQDIASLTQRIDKAKKFGQRAMGNPSISNTSNKIVSELTDKLNTLKKKRDKKPTSKPTQAKGMKGSKA